MPVLKDFTCDQCHLRSDPGRKCFVVGDGVDDAELMVVDAGPGAAENLTGQAFQGDASSKFFGYLEQAGMPADVTKFFTYATKCANSGDNYKTPPDDALAACLGHLEEEILLVRPKLVIALGIKTAKTSFGIDGLLKDVQGQFFDRKIGDHTFKVMVTNRPAQFVHNAAGMESCLADLRGAKKFLRPDENAAVQPTIVYDYRIIRTWEQWREFKAIALAATKTSSDIETTGFTPHLLMNGKGGKALLGIGFTFKKYSGWFLPVHPKYGIFPDTALIMAELKDLMANLKGVSFHNGNFDLAFMRYFGIKCPGIDYDTFLALHLLNERAPRGLDSEIERLRPDLGRYWLKLEKYLDDETGYFNAPLEELAEYCMKDCDAAWSSREDTEARLEGTDLGRVFKRITIPLLLNIVEAQNTGIQVDLPYVETLGDKYKLMAADQEHKISEFFGLEINLGSPQQLAAMLYGKQMLDSYAAGKQTKGTATLIAIAQKTNLELPILKRNKPGKGKTGSGAPSTDEDTIDLLEAQFSGQYPVFQNLLKFREYKKILSTYVGGGAPELIDGELVETKGKGVRNNVDIHGRVHSTFNLGKTDTYRLSSEGPNMQNIPATGEMRQMFIARPGWKLVGGDYSQAELRIMATLSQDPGLMQAFAMGQDIHSAVASILFNKPIEECGKKSEERKRTKAINFGIIFGKGAKSLAEDMGIDEYESQKFLTMYFNRFINVKMWMDRTKKYAHDYGHVKSIFGRIRHLDPEINDYSNKAKMAHAERQAMNFPVQSSAADCTYVANNRACAEIKKRGMQSQFILTVHDELIFESPESEAEEMAVILKTAAEAPIQGITVPMKMDTMVMTTWAEKG